MQESSGLWRKGEASRPVGEVFLWDKTPLSKWVYRRSTRELECTGERVRQLEVLQLCVWFTAAGDRWTDHGGQARESHREWAAGCLTWKGFINPALQDLWLKIDWRHLTSLFPQSSQGLWVDIWSWQSKGHWVQERAITLCVWDQMKWWISAGNNVMWLLLGTLLSILGIFKYHS